MLKLLVKIDTWTMKKKVAILSLIVILLFAFSWLYVFSAKFQALEEVKEREVVMNGKITNAYKIIRKLPILEAEFDKNSEKLKKVMNQLPDKREIQLLVSSLSTTANALGLEDTKYEPLAENIKEFYVEVPIQMQLAGTFHQMLSFFDHVTRLSRMVKIGNILFELDLEEPTAVMLRSSFVVTAYRSLDDLDREKIAEVEAAKKKRRRH